MKKLKTFVLCALPLIFNSCLDAEDKDIKPVVEPPETVLLKKDSLTTGKHYGITIGQTATAVYPGVQTLHDSLDVNYLNLVSNFVTDFSTLKERLPLYSYMTFDAKPGSSGGVQLWFENRKLKSIYLNSGKRLGQWPENINASEAVREGESSEVTAEKLISLQGNSRYKSRFEHAMLGVKTLQEAFDPAMKTTPEWYFGYRVDERHTNYVHVHFSEGKVIYILVNHMKTL